MLGQFYGLNKIVGIWTQTLGHSNKMSVVFHRPTDPVICRSKTPGCTVWEASVVSFSWASHSHDSWLAARAGKRNQILCCDWLCEQARWSSGVLAVSHKRNFPESHNKSFIDQACSVKMAGCGEVIFWLFMDWDLTLANIQPSWPNKLGQ